MIVDGAVSTCSGVLVLIFVVDEIRSEDLWEEEMFQVSE